MRTNNTFWYLDQADQAEFQSYWGTDDEDLLVAGSATSNRLMQYLSPDENQTIRVIFSAVVHDFELPPVRYSMAIALTIYAFTMDGRDVKDVDQRIAQVELDLLLKHLMDDEKVSYEKGLEFVASRWSEYLANPSAFT